MSTSIAICFLFVVVHVFVVHAVADLIATVIVVGDSHKCHLGTSGSRPVPSLAASGEETMTNIFLSPAELSGFSRCKFIKVSGRSA